ncbi:hypothetical protein IFM89_021680 [Coptis chinensis]|uniref:GATA-type domain-containing protein n=1 Tax=Coptis chinensis TaxID=261450 RepID=A0A835IDW2_9MAGN|nr:hypothetical protein IFM89_021680 [Coptis chinensis]
MSFRPHLAFAPTLLKQIYLTNHQSSFSSFCTPYLFLSCVSPSPTSMTPTYLHPSPPSFLLEDPNQFQAQEVQQLYNREQDQEVGMYVLREESSDEILSSTHSTGQSDDGSYSFKLSSCKQEHEVIKEENQNVLSVKWMSSKLRLMKKMINTERTVVDKPTQTTSWALDTDNSSNSSSCTIIRTCSDCNTTKTPLWRSGPRGPKSLCNACGIRQRKARRARAAAEAGANDTLLVASESSSTHSSKLHFKAKRCKLTARRSPKKLCFNDLALRISKNTAYHRVYPQDEKEAAILLMALSCNLAHG